MTETYNGLSDEQLSVIGTQFKPNYGHATWYRLATTALTLLTVAAIWKFQIAPEDQSPRRLMVEPASEMLATFVQPAPSLAWISKDLGFEVDAPNLKPLGVELKTIGVGEFDGRHAAVLEYTHDYVKYLLYSFDRSSERLGQMRETEVAGKRFYLASEDAVSVIVWKDGHFGFRALAAKQTEQGLLSVATEIARISHAEASLSG